MNQELYAARITKPPDVKTAPKLTGDKHVKKVNKTNNQKSKRLIVPENDDSDMEMYEDRPGPSLLTQPYQPPAPPKPTFKTAQKQSTADNMTPTEKTTRIKRVMVPVSEQIEYNITQDVLDQKANIDMKDLLIAAPALKRDLIRSIRNTKLVKPNTLAFVEDDDVDTTAIYTTVYIGEYKVKAILDTGSAKTVMSKKLADTLGLDIDAPSTSIFTLGNGTKQAALGIIYDVPLNIGAKLIIPGSIEVLPVCPTQLIIGNNWMKRAKARLNLENKTIKIEYKNNLAHVPFVFTRGAEAPVVIKTSVSAQYTQENETRELPTKKIVDSDVSSDEFSSDEEDDIDDLEPEGTTDEENEDQLMMLEDEFNERDNCNCGCGLLMLDSTIRKNNDFDIIVKEPFYIPPLSTKEYSIDFEQLLEEPEDMNEKEFNIICNFTNPKLQDLKSEWQFVSSSFRISRNELTFILSNVSEETMEFQVGESIGDLELISDDDVEEIEWYRISKPKPQCQEDLHTHEIQPNQDIQPSTQEKSAANHDSYEEKVKHHMDIENIPPEIKKDFLNLIMEFDHLFDWDNDKIGNIDVMEHNIRLKPDAQPKRVRPYRLSPLETESLRQELDKLLRLGIIEKGGYSNWASPIIMLKKKDGSYRIVADFRYLNSQSETMNYPLNNIDELLDTLNKAYWMTTFDLRSGFFQANISRESQPLTTVVCPLGDYFFKKLPMGIKTSPSVFSQMMEKCFHDLINSCVIIYLDDVTCYTNTDDPLKHLQDLEKTFNCMSERGIVLNPKKCHYFKESILFLGFVVTRNTIEPNPETVNKVKNFPIPKSIKQLRSFLGLCSYYRRFVPNFAKIARPLHNQLKTTKKIPWNDEATSAFNTLKECLTTEPVLRKPDFNLPFYVVTDASIDGLGAILTQKDELGHEHPIIYSSRSVHGAERNYGISKLELLAVVWAVKLYRPYLHGSPFTVTVISDHSALNGLLKTKQPSGILARWIEILSEYDFEIVYRPGRVNESADFLSRLGH